jgi:hypothetical protein
MLESRAQIANQGVTVQKATAGHPTYEGAFNPGEGYVTVIRNAYAAVSGPAGSYTAGSIEAADAALFAAGYLVSSEWTVAKYGDNLYAELTCMV